jgi:precorrin-2/cobalt-factor-2 C20-methyltransferase
MLIGISLGPGDPELMTFKAAAALKKCAKVFVPGEMAANLVQPYCKPDILDFPMISDTKKLEKIWSSNANTIASFVATGLTGFACIGDVNTFSTFSHLERVIKQHHHEIKIETIPGVGVVPALASRFRTPLEKSFEVSDGSAVESVIRIKATRPKELAEELRLKGFEDFTLGTRLCTAEEMIIRGEMPEKSDYFSVMLAMRQR